VGELVDALVRVLEFMVQGAMAVLLGGYVLAWVHKFKDSVYEHAQELTEYMIPHWRDRIHAHTLIAAGLGTLYLIGVVTNAIGYWLLAPAHGRVIASVVGNPTKRTVDVAALIKLTMRQLIGSDTHDSGTDYIGYIQDEVEWRNLNLEAMKHALDPLLKQGRVIRGTVIISLGFLIVSMFKTTSFLVCLLLLFLPGKAGEKMFDSMVDPPKPGKEPPEIRTPTEKRALRRTTGNYAVGNLIYAGVAFLVLWFSVGAYMTLEREYHSMAHYGPTSAKAAAALKSTTVK
jgi:hypothetical protein